MPNSRQKLDRAAYEREIKDYSEAYRNELSVMQITPFYHESDAFLPVRANMQAQIKEVLAGLDSSLSAFFRLCRSEDVTGAASTPDRLFVVVGHSYNDRIRAGYENIYRTLRSMAPCLEDCRFVIEEMYNNWVDEYKFEAGELLFERGFAEDEFITDLHDYFYNEALQRSQDRAWVSFCARQMIDWADFCLTQVENIPAARPSQYDKARSYLERAGRLGVEEALHLAQTARLHRLESR